MIALRLIAVGAAILAGLSACGPAGPVFHAIEKPGRLSDWNLFELSSNTLTPVSDTLVFRPANQLFTDYAQKLRTVWMPQGSQATLVDGEIQYPIGTVLSKTFYYPTDNAGNSLKLGDQIQQAIDLTNNRLVETRLLVRRETGWDAFPYVWNSEESEAFLRVAGASLSMDLKSDTETLSFTYFVPNENQCAGCHVTEHPDGEMHPLGAIASQLTTAFEHPASNSGAQIEEFVARGWLSSNTDMAKPVAWRDETAALQDRALAYLNMNCGHCHNPEGAADTSALILNGSHGQLVNIGVCKPPVAAGGGAGDMLYSIVPGQPGQSILLYRMNSDRPDEMMPELGRSLVHAEGVELINQWIAQLNGNCD